MLITCAGQEQRHGGLGGLKRLGTVIGRRRQSTQPSTQSFGRSPSPEKRTLGSLSSPFRRGDSSRDMATIPSPDVSMQNSPSSLPREELALPGAADVPSSVPHERPSNEQTNGDSKPPISPPISSDGPMNGLKDLNDGNQQQGNRTVEPPRSSSAVSTRTVWSMELDLTRIGISRCGWFQCPTVDYRRHLSGGARGGSEVCMPYKMKTMTNDILVIMMRPSSDLTSGMSQFRRKTSMRRLL